MLRGLLFSGSIQARPTVNPNDELPMPIERVIVGVDESGRSDHAIRAALSLASKTNAAVELIHSVQTPSARWRSADPIRIATLNAEALTQASKSINKHLADCFTDAKVNDQPLESVLRILPGTPAKSILDQTAQLPIGSTYVFVGPHKPKGLLDFGSTARSILASSKHPVWIQNDEPRPIRKILVPIDLSDECTQTLRVALELTEIFDAEITVIHCFSVPTFAYSSNPEYPDLSPSYVIDDLRQSTEDHFHKVIADFDWNGRPHRSLFVVEEPVPTVLDMQERTDLIVMGTHGTTGFASAVLGSTAYEILKKATSPIVAVRHDKSDWLL
ncbi:MAG: nucleotide-binding universal stress UspA family protein [Planctomycetota bacterium]